MHKISYSKKQFVIQTGLHQSTQKWLSQSKLLFALVFKRQTLEARIQLLSQSSFQYLSTSLIVPTYGPVKLCCVST